MIEPRYGVLQTLFAERVFRIPHYQRFYSWHTRQREDLFSDLRKLTKLGEDQHHFMATIVCYRTPETKSVGAAQYRIYDVVDGQQRLTTLILLLKCIELAMPEKSEVRRELGKILVKRDGHLILLQTNNANEYIFNRFIQKRVIPEEAELQTHSDQNLANAITNCKEFVQEWDEMDGISTLMSLVLHRLGFVVYDTEDPRVVYTVFEVLNSRGLAVDLLDKTKSVLMGQAFERARSKPARDAEIHRLEGIWGQIYREIAKESVPGDEIVRVTATLYYGTGASKPCSADESLESMRQACTSSDKPRHVSERLLDVARKLVALHGNVFLGPVTDILHARILAVAIMSTTFNENERKNLLDQWERTSFRIFGLFGKDARTGVGDFVRMSAQIVSKDKKMRTVDQIMEGLQLLGSEFPIDKALEEGLVGKDCYEQSPEMCRYILSQYEEHLAEEAGVGTTIDEHERNAIWRRRASDSIEHIFPQSPWGEPGWKGKMRIGSKPEQHIFKHVGRIGNLLLLPILFNQQAKVRPFPDKKKLYAKHGLRMIREVCKRSDWTLKHIEERERKIIKWAKERWSDV